MRIKSKRIRVYPNPWGVHPSSAHHHHGHSTIDSRGKPCGVCMQDPEDGGEPGRMVGTWVDAAITNPVTVGELRNARQRTGYSYLGESNDESSPFDLANRLSSKTPVELTLTQYYAERIRDGSLIAADLESARAVGTDSFFEDPKSLFPRLARAAAKRFNNHFDADQDAYSMLIAERRAAKGVEPPSEKKAEPTAPVASENT